MSNQRIIKHFEEEAKEYDHIILTLIPNYKQMVEMLVSILPFSSEQAFSVIDLGCGTGTVSRKIRDTFPSSCLTCMDIAGNMLSIAAVKNGPDTTLIQADFKSFIFPQKYDAIVSSLALHHLPEDEDKKAFYFKIYQALNSGGVFANIDVVTSGDPALQKVYMQKWKEFMIKNTSVQEVETKWLPNYYAEDRPIPLARHIEMLNQSGFDMIDVVYKHFNYAVYCAKK
jgi:tRNA (cmo5U34)-methyltransferase